MVMVLVSFSGVGTGVGDSVAGEVRKRIGTGVKRGRSVAEAEVVEAETEGMWAEVVEAGGG